MPRCLCSVTFGTCIPPIITWESDELGEEEICPMERCTLFSALNSIPQVFAQSAPESISDERDEQIVLERLPKPYAVVSSAKRAHSFNIDCGKSLMYNRNNVGPRTVPCGMPDFTVSHDDSDPWTRTRCWRSVKKEENHFNAAWENPTRESL